MAATGEGVDELWHAIGEHRAHLVEGGLLDQRRTERVAHELHRVMTARSSVVIDEVAAGEEFSRAVKEVAAGELDPYEAAERLMPK